MKYGITSHMSCTSDLSHPQRAVLLRRGQDGVAPTLLQPCLQQRTRGRRWGKGGADRQEERPRALTGETHKLLFTGGALHDCPKLLHSWSNWSAGRTGSGSVLRMGSGSVLRRAPQVGCLDIILTRIQMPCKAKICAQFISTHSFDGVTKGSKKD